MDTIKSSLLLTIALCAQCQAVKLTHPILAKLDGKFGIVGEQIKNMIHIRRELNNRLFGHKTRHPSERLGHYEFDGRTYSLKELVKLEKQAKAENNTLLTAQLKELLEHVKEDIIELTDPFLGLIRNMKSFTTPLIEESCAKRNRPNSYLLVWQHIPKGQEVQQFREKMKSFADVAEFCRDVGDYLVDIIQSAPKAYQQFRDRYLK